MKFMQASLLLVALLLVGISTSQSTTFVHTFTGGLPFCTQCGLLGEYACSPDANGMTLGNWNSGIINFRDPIPQGNYATGMTVTLIGSYACNVANKLAMFGISVNGFTHAVRESTKGGQCKCDTCDGNEALSFTLRNGIPLYKYNGATNTLQITPYVDSVCLNKVNVTIFYSPTVVSPPTPLPEYYLAPTIPTGYDRVGCSVCNPGRNQWCSASNNNTFSLEFTDPLPAGFNYVVSIELYLSLNMVERAYTYSSTLAAKIQDEVIATKTIIDSGFRNKCGCMADYQFNSATYQRGWPGYVQHGKNYISLVVGKYSQTYGNICVGRLGIKLIYYAASDDEVKEIYLDDVKTI